MARRIITDEEKAALIDEILEKIVEGQSLVSILKSSKKMPAYSHFMKWVGESEEIEKRYVQAKQEQADYLADEMLKIADEAPDAVLGNDRSDSARVNAVKIRLDARKWIASKLKPKKYGDKLDLGHSGSLDTNQHIKKASEMSNEELMEAFAQKKIGGEVGESKTR